MGTQDPKQIIESGFDRVAKDYSSLEGDIRWPRMKWLGKLLNLLGPCSRVLDIGCGSGDPADVEISKNHSVTGIDISGAQLNLARENIPGGCFLLPEDRRPLLYHAPLPVPLRSCGGTT